MKHLEMPPESYTPLSRPGRAVFRAKVEVRSVVGRRGARRQLASSQKLHLGSGDHVLAGWANVDALGLPGVTPWDLTRALPVEDSTKDFVFSEHFVEHITLEQARSHLADCFRVLKPGGVLRVSTPDLEQVVDAYLSGKVDGWADVDWHPATPCQLVNEALHSWGHLFVFDERELTSVLRQVGFNAVRRVAWHESAHPELRDLERRPDHGEVIVEAVK